MLSPLPFLKKLIFIQSPVHSNIILGKCQRLSEIINIYRRFFYSAVMKKIVKKTESGSAGNKIALFKKLSDCVSPLFYNGGH